ncbi:MAG: DUF3667 domain-containing protein [Pseudomonadota bacterium]
MSDVTEGIGGAIQGTLFGRATEPEHGEAYHRKTAETAAPPRIVACANCGTEFAGNYCPQCGQKSHIHRTLSAIVHDLIHGVLHLDGKLSHTLPLLAFKPGRLTRRYIEGERARFVSPLSMFLFSVFAMFAIFQMIGLTAPTDFEPNADLAGTASVLRAEAEESRDDLQQELETLAANDPRRQEVEEELAKIENGLVRLDEIEAGELMSLGDNAELTFSGTGIEWIDEGVVKKWRENPGLMIYKLQANGYKFSWLLIPLSIPFVWLMFAWRRRFKAYDHAVFVTYSLSFISLLFITVSLIAVSPIGASWAGLLFLVAAPLHLYKHLKYTYDLSRLSAIWRFAVLFVFINIVAVLFFQVLLVLGAF